MRLRDTVKRFATEVYTDIFSTETFLGHIDPFEEVTNSGVSAHRRILEVIPSIIIPAGNVVKGPNGTNYIIASKNLDFWAGTEIRHKYPVIIPTGMGEVGDMGQILSGAGATQNVYTFPYFVRREIIEDDMADHLAGYELFFPPSFAFTRADILSMNGDYYRLHTDTFIDGAGFLVAQATKIENALQNFTVNSDKNVYDPVNDTYSSTPYSNVPCFVEYLRKSYEFVSPAFENIEPGDKSISVLKSEVPTVKTGNTFDDFRVVAVRDQGTWITAQCRNA